MANNERLNYYEKPSYTASNIEPTNFEVGMEVWVPKYTKYGMIVKITGKSIFSVRFDATTLYHCLENELESAS